MAKLDTLTEAELSAHPDDVFEILDLLGEGAYGTVHKAMHLRTGVNVAIKKVPADSDMEAIVREITHMHKMEHERVVKYYGSYWTEGTLWIVMEHCAVGSVNDIMSLCQVTLSESQIGCILRDVLIGLEYLHKRNVIHRDLKAANILVTSDGVAKLADFGVSSQLTDELMKRNTVIGTPFWMAPEVIQEVGHDIKADIWSLGITAIEMADGVPPLSQFHAMRAIFMIPVNPPPTLKCTADFSVSFVDFIAQCLQRDPNARPTVTELLQHPFIVKKDMLHRKGGKKTLNTLIDNTFVRMAERQEQGLASGSDTGTFSASTMVAAQGTTQIGECDQDTLACGTMNNNGTMVQNNYDCGTMVDSGTMVIGGADDGTMVLSGVDCDTMVNFGTMVIDGDCDTIKSCGKSNGDYSTGTTTAPGRTLDDGAVDNATLWITKKDRSRDKKSPPKADKQPAFLNRPLAFGDHKPKSAKKVPPPLTPQEQLKALGIVELKARQDALS